MNEIKIQNQSEEIESVGYIPENPYKVSEENCYQCTKDGEPCFFHTNYNKTVGNNYPTGVDMSHLD